jgi:hypothetical protein
MNLVLNAKDAMPGKGKFTLETSNVELDDQYITQHKGHPIKKGSYVMVIAFFYNSIRFRKC